MKTNITKIITILTIVLTNFTYGQLENYIDNVNPYLSEDSIQNGFFYFDESNNFLPGQVYQNYKSKNDDNNNQMVLKSQHTDHLIEYTHYRYQQFYKNIPVEGSFYNEHFSPEGKLVFINGKLANYINQSSVPQVSDADAIYELIHNIQMEYEQNGELVKFAWQDTTWENQIQNDAQDSNVTWFPTAKLLWSIDTLKNMGFLISGSRYTLAYKIPITIIEPESKSLIYFVDANTGEILKFHSTSFNDGPGLVYGYGTKIIDTRWKGGFPHGHYYLRTNDNTRNVWTKKGNGGGNYDGVWGLISDVKDDDDNWGNYDITEVSAHYNVSTTWDYYKQVFGRTGMDDNGAEIRVKTNWNEVNAAYDYLGYNKNCVSFGKNNGKSFGMEPSIVAHEYTHGITDHTSNLSYEFESGALNESFSDIFGIVVQAKKYDNGSTDWIIGNTVPALGMSRSLEDPKSMGTHIENQTIAAGQPDTYEGDFWCSNCPNTKAGDFGGVHINSGVQNHWFYLLANGGNGQNDIGDYYNISNGIGKNNSAKIAYLALTSILGNSSQYINSRQATITAAELIFGKCSVAYQTTKNAWYAVGVGPKDNCKYTASINTFEKDEIVVYPNPASNLINIDLPYQTKNPITIVDLTGHIVQSLNSNNKHIKVDVSMLSKGVYFVNINVNNNRVIKKIIIQ